MVSKGDQKAIMNLPNKLTLSRIILVPFFVASLLINFPFHTAVALVIFVVATFTDMFDGKIARSRGLVTDFGKFADPLADKILVLSALLCLCKQVGATASQLLSYFSENFQ